MNTVEVVAFVALWLAFLAMAGLVLILYRQVEKAYRTSEGEGEEGGLLPGVAAPDVEVMGAHGIEPLAFPAPEGLTLLAFLTSTCAGCVDLARALGDMDDFDGHVIGLVNGEDTGELRGLPAHVEMRWLAHPPDVIRTYGVRKVPLVYALRGRTVLASRGATDAAGLARLLDDALEHERALGGAVEPAVR